MACARKPRNLSNFSPKFFRNNTPRSHGKAPRRVWVPRGARKPRSILVAFNDTPVSATPGAAIVPSDQTNTTHVSKSPLTPGLAAEKSKSCSSDANRTSAPAACAASRASGSSSRRSSSICSGNSAQTWSQPSMDPVMNKFASRLGRAASSNVVTPKVWHFSLRHPTRPDGPAGFSSPALDRRLSSNVHSYLRNGDDSGGARAGSPFNRTTFWRYNDESAGNGLRGPTTRRPETGFDAPPPDDESAWISTPR